MESKPVENTLQPGIYKILNDANPDSAIDLSGYDMKTVIGKQSFTNSTVTRRLLIYMSAYGDHNGENQKVFRVIGYLHSPYSTIISGKLNASVLAILLDACSTAHTLLWNLESSRDAR
jgi:hypothetical protein